MFRTRFLTLLAVSVLLLAACGGSPSPTPVPPTATAVPVATDTPVPPPAEEPTTEPEAEETEEPTEEEPAAEATAEPAEEATPPAEEEAGEAEEPTEEPAEEEPAAEATAEPAEEATPPAEEEAEEAPAEAPAESEVADDEAGAAAVPPVTTTPTGFTVTAMRRVTDIINERFAIMATIAPDGSAIAYIELAGRRGARERNLCIFTFSNANIRCYPAPEGYVSTPYALFWSPDSTAIAFSENPIQLGHESDIWLFRLAEAEFVNLTDDGITGSFRRAGSTIDTLDYMPMWNETDGQLYFWRGGFPDGLPNLTLALYRVDPAGGEPELVRDVTDEISSPLLTVASDSFYLNGPAALSPDGSQVAVLLQTFGADFSLSAMGLWVIDLADPAAAPRLLAETDDLQEVLPGSQNLPAVPRGLAWTADGGLVLAATSRDTHAPLLLFYYFDSEGMMTPVVDFSPAETLSDLFNVTSPAGLPLRAYSPWTASLAPDRASLLLYNDLTGVNGLFQAMLPPGDDFPALVFNGDSNSFETDPRSSVAANGMIIMYGLLFTLDAVE
jgi:outer membrane biosynthesis protein TonB